MLMSLQCGPAPLRFDLSAGDFEIQAEQRSAYPRQLRLKLCDATSARYARPVKAIKQSPRICGRQRRLRSHRFRTDAPDRPGGGRRTGKAAFCIPDMELHTRPIMAKAFTIVFRVKAAAHCCKTDCVYVFLYISKERCPQRVSQILLQREENRNIYIKNNPVNSYSK